MSTFSYNFLGMDYTVENNLTITKNIIQYFNFKMNQTQFFGALAN